MCVNLGTVSTSIYIAKTTERESELNMADPQAKLVKGTPR